MKRTILTVVFLTALMVGCEDSPAPPPRPIAQERPEAAIKIKTPARTTYTGEGKIVYRKVDAIRILSPFGVSPGEVISAQKPMTVTEGPVPGVNITPAGITSSPNGGGTWSSGGFKRTWWDKIVSFFRKLKWMLIIGGIAMLALWLWPVTRPIISAIGRIIASVIPVFGSAIEWLVGKARTATRKRQLGEVISGGQKFKSLLAADTMLNDAQKARVLELFKAAQTGKQNKDTQSAVVVIKSET